MWFFRRADRTAIDAAFERENLIVREAANIAARLNISADEAAHILRTGPMYERAVLATVSDDDIVAEFTARGLKL